MLLSDGANYDTSTTSQADALAALQEANVRVISIGLKSDQYTPATLKLLAQKTNGSYIEADNPAALEAIYKEIGQQLLERVRGHVSLAAAREHQDQCGGEEVTGYAPACTR